VPDSATRDCRAASFTTIRGGRGEVGAEAGRLIVGRQTRGHRAGLPRAQRRSGPGPLRRPLLVGLAHHMTLVSVAHGFLTLERLRRPNSWRRPEPVAAARPAAGLAGLLGRRLPHLPASRAALAVTSATITSTKLTESIRSMPSKSAGDGTPNQTNLATRPPQREPTEFCSITELGRRAPTQP
jgi:hypothetical protein